MDALQASRVGGTVWLSYWTESTDDSGRAPHGPFWYLGVYAGISGIQVLHDGRKHIQQHFNLLLCICQLFWSWSGGIRSGTWASGVASQGLKCSTHGSC